MVGVSVVALLLFLLLHVCCNVKKTFWKKINFEEKNPQATEILYK